MTLRAYWWDPRRSARSAAGELVHHGRAWAYLARRSRRLENFGDAVNPQVLEELTGQSVAWAPLGKEDVVAIGSVLNKYAELGGVGQVFGSGVRDPSTLGGAGVPRERVIGVRGTLTAEVVGVGSDQVLGDPGLVVAQMFPATRRTNQPTFVPHFTLPGTAVGRALIDQFRRGGYRVVLPNASPTEVADAVSSASFVVGTSLHGLVFADAYGIPCALMEAPGLHEPEFKYRDYCSVLGKDFVQVESGRAIAASAPDPAMEERADAVSDRLPSVVAGLYDAAKRLA